MLDTLFWTCLYSSVLCMDAAAADSPGQAFSGTTIGYMDPKSKSWTEPPGALSVIGIHYRVHSQILVHFWVASASLALVVGEEKDNYRLF